MENFSNVEDNTLLFQLDETVSDQIDPFNNEVEIQNMKNQSNFTNLSMNNYYSTCFYSENYPMSDDFSFMFNNEELKKANSFFGKKIQKFKKIERKISQEKQKLFFVYKKHKNDCKHKIKKIHRNKIKSLIEKDFFQFFISEGDERKLSKKRYICENKKFSQNFLKNFKKISTPKIKKTTNRNFRLFDKDVIIKKIMSNFFKFLKIIFEFLFSKVLNIKNLKIKEFESGNFYTIEQCQEYLNKHNFFDFVQMDRNISLNERENFQFLFNSNFFQIFSVIFINSSYFFEYLIEKIKSKYDNDYYICFMNYTKDIIAL